MDASGMMYLYYPMPFATRAKIELVNNSGAAVTGQWTVSHQPFTGDFSKVGRLKATYSAPTLYNSGSSDVVLLDANGTGQVVGVVQSVTGPTDQSAIQGDERIKIDSNESASFNIQGTGTTDFYNGGFFFAEGPFSRPTHGNTTHVVDAYDNVSMYRQFIADSIPFRSRVRLTMEHGNRNEVTETCSSLVYYYLQTAQRMSLTPDDVLDFDTDYAGTSHNFTTGTPEWGGIRTFQFESEGYPTETHIGRWHRAYSEFTMAINPFNHGVVLRRLLDQGVGMERARVYVDGVPIGIWYKAGVFGTYHWRTEEFMIPGANTEGKSAISIRIEFISSNDVWTAFRYETYSIL
jgi:hypothetical protein